MSRFPVEPWNTFSNLIFLFIIIYFAYKTKLNSQKYKFIMCALPILLIGFTGGTIYHATRSRNIWLYLDFIPIMVLALFAAIYFLGELTKNYYKSFSIVIFSFLLIGIVRSSLELPKFLSIAFGYGCLAALIIIPLLMVAKRNEWKNLSLLISAFASFLVAITCRTIDGNFGKELLPMGTHFLWHLFGGFAVFLLFEFVFRQSEIT